MKKIIKGTFEPRHLNTFPRRAARERLYLAGDFSLLSSPLDVAVYPHWTSLKRWSSISQRFLHRSDVMYSFKGILRWRWGYTYMYCAARADTTHTTICTLLLFIIQRGFWWGCKRAGRGWKRTWTMSGRIDGSDIFMHHHAEFFSYGETKS